MSKIIAVVAILCLLGSCSTNAQTLVLYQEGKDLCMTNNNEKIVYWNDVIDYSYDSESNLIFVLHEERSDHTDNVGFVSAMEEGLTVGGFVRIYRLSENISNVPTLIYENDFTWVNPWSIDSGDLDNDDLIDLFIGCYRATEFYGPDRRPFVVTWDGEKIVRKWTGSYIGNDGFMTGQLKDIIGEDGKDELILTILKDDGTTEDRVYQWGTFTFEYLYSITENDY